MSTSKHGDTKLEEEVPEHEHPCTTSSSHPDPSTHEREWQAFLKHNLFDGCEQDTEESLRERALSCYLDLQRQYADLTDVLFCIESLARKTHQPDLADWAMHEGSGYPADAALPDYRIKSSPIISLEAVPNGRDDNLGALSFDQVLGPAKDSLPEVRITNSIASIEHDLIDGDPLLLDDPDLLETINANSDGSYHCTRLVRVVATEDVKKVVSIVKRRAIRELEAFAYS